MYALDSSLVDLAACDKMGQKARLEMLFGVVEKTWGVAPPCSAQEWCASKRLKTDLLVAYLSGIMDAVNGGPAFKAVGSEGRAQSPRTTADSPEVANEPGEKQGSADSASSAPLATRHEELPLQQEIPDAGTDEADDAGAMDQNEKKESSRHEHSERKHKDGHEKLEPSTSSRDSQDSPKTTAAQGKEARMEEGQDDQPDSQSLSHFPASRNQSQSVVHASAVDALRVAQDRIRLLEQQLSEANGAKMHLVRNVDFLMQNLQRFRRACLSDDRSGPNDASTNTTSRGPSGRTPLPKSAEDLGSPISGIATVNSPYSHRPGANGARNGHLPQAHSSRYLPLSAHSRQPFLRTPNDFGGSSGSNYADSRHSGFGGSLQGRGFPQRGGESPFGGPNNVRATSNHFDLARENFPAWEEAFRDPVAIRTPLSGTPPPFDLTLELQAELNAAGHRNRWAEDQSALERRPARSWSDRKVAPGTGSHGLAGSQGSRADKSRRDSSRQAAFFRNTSQLRTPQSVVFGTSGPPGGAALLDSADDIIDKDRSGVLSPFEEPPARRVPPRSSFMHRVEVGMQAQRYHLQQQVDQLSRSHQQLHKLSSSRSRSRLAGDYSDSIMVEETTETSESVHGGSGGSLARSDLFDDVGGGSDSEEECTADKGDVRTGNRTPAPVSGSLDAQPGDANLDLEADTAQSSSLHRMSALSDDTVGISPIKDDSDDCSDGADGTSPPLNPKPAPPDSPNKTEVHETNREQSSSSLLETMTMLSAGSLGQSTHRSLQGSRSTLREQGAPDREGHMSWGTPIAKQSASQAATYARPKRDAPPPPPPRSSSLPTSPSQTSSLQLDDLNHSPTQPPQPISTAFTVATNPAENNDSDQFSGRNVGRANVALSDNVVTQVEEQLRRQVKSATEAALTAAEASRAAFDANRAYHAQFSQGHSSREYSHHLSSAQISRSCSPPSFLAAVSSMSGNSSYSSAGAANSSPSPPSRGSYAKLYHAQKLQQHRLNVHGMPAPSSSAPGS